MPIKTSFPAILFFVFCTSLSLAQAPNIQFSKVFGGNHDDIGSVLIQTRDKGFLVSGNTNSTTGDFQGVVHSAPNTYDLFAIKTDSSGNFLWSRVIVGGSSVVWCAAETNDAYIIGGYTDSNNHDFTGFPPGRVGFLTWLDKLDGHIIQSKGYTGGLNGQIYGLDVLSDNSIIATGMMAGTAIPGNAGSGDCWVAKLNGITGNVIWQKMHGAYYMEQGSCIKATETGFLVGGVTNSNLDGLHPDGGGLLYDLDTAGNLVNFKVFGKFQFRGAEKTSSGAIICGGISYDTSEVVHEYKGGGFDYFAMKLNSQGDTIWTRSYGGSGRDYCTNLRVTNDGGALLFGNTNSHGGDISTIPGIWDMWLVRIDSLGDIVWEKTLGSNLVDVAGTMTLTCDNSYAFTSLVSQVTKDVVGTALGAHDVWVCKMEPDGLDNYNCDNLLSTSSISKDNIIKIFPNPANEFFTVEMGMPPASPVAILLTDLLGNTVKKDIITKQRYDIDVSGLQKGIYFITFLHSDRIETRKLVVN